VWKREKPPISKLFTNPAPWMLLMCFAAASVMFGQQPAHQTAASVLVSRQGIQDIAQKAEKDKSLDEQSRDQVLGLCDEAMKALSAAKGFAASASRYESDLESIPRLIESLNKQLLYTVPDQGMEVPEQASFEDVQQLLQQASAELDSRRTAVQEIKQSADKRNTHRTEINSNIAALNQKIYELDSSIESVVETAGKTLLRDATLANLAARRRAALEEKRALKAELVDLNLRSPLRLLRRQRAERRVTEAVQRERRLEEILTRKVHSEMEENLSRLRQETAETVGAYPSLKPLTDEILHIADQLFGPEGVEKTAEPLTAELNSLQEAHRKVVQLMEVSRNKYEALGKRAELQRWFPEIPPEIPPRHELEQRMEELAVLLVDTNATLIGLQDRRANLPDFDSELALYMDSLESVTDEEKKIQQYSLCRGLLTTRTSLLDRLILRYTEYHSELKELEKASRELHDELQRGYDFALEHIFWQRSISGPLLPRAGDILDAARWLFANPEWPGSISRSLQWVYRSPWIAIVFLALFYFLLAGRKRFVLRLAEKGKLACESDKPLRPLLESTLHTFLLSAPVPLAMAGLGLFLNLPQTSGVAVKVGAALFRISLLTFGLELIVQICRDGGFAQIQYGLSVEKRVKISREVRSLMLVLIPSALIAMSFGIKAADHVGDPTRVAHLESLGRIALIVGLLAYSVTSLRLYRWLTRQGRGVSYRFASFIMLILAIVCVTAVFLSVFGWHLSAFVLAVLALRSFFLILDIALITAFIERLRQIRWKVLYERESRKLREQTPERDEDAEAAEIRAEITNVESTNREVGQSIRLGVFLITIIGLYAIWSTQLPTLRFLDRVQLLPAVRYLPEKEPDAAVQMERTAPKETPKTPDAEQADVKTPVMPPTPANLMRSSLQTEEPDAAESAPAPGYSMTLSALLGAVGVLLVIIVMVKYIPSLLDFFILSRFPIVSGDRKAITIIIRYVLVLIGISAMGAKLGLKWSQIQWLAAAFSFGLGFGLQDIFANFFSGLVLLFERPMHVGDLCRFGDQVGTVEAIGLRSTRIRSLDRTVINVPNADFSKKEVVNYTKRDQILLRTTIGLRYETTDEQLRYVLVKMRELLLSHPKVAEDPARVRFIGYGDYSLDVEIFAYVKAEDWSEFLSIQEDVLLRLMRIVEESGTGFAFPSQTTYLARDSGLDSERTASAEAEVQSWRSAKELPFPDFSDYQRWKLRDKLDFPPAGSPHADNPAERKGAKKEPPDSGQS